MILIVIPTLDLDRGREVGRRAQLSAGVDTRLVIVHDEKHQGFTKTANQGMRQRKPGEDVCLLNDDILTFNYGWLKILQETMYSNPRYGIVGPSGKAAGPTRTGKLGDFGTQIISMFPFWCALVRGNMIDQVGYLEEAFIHYSSDTYYCRQASRAGWKHVWVKSVFLWHQHQGSGFKKEWRTKDTATYQRLCRS